MNAIHDSFLYYTQVRWLSRGNVIIRFHDLLGEIQSFLENHWKDVLLAKKEDFCGLSLAYLSDIFKLLNELNRKMQGLDNNVITHTDTVKTCIAKLGLWHGRVPENIPMQIHRYSEELVTVSDETIYCYTCKLLNVVDYLLLIIEPHLLCSQYFESFRKHLSSKLRIVPLYYQSCCCSVFECLQI